MADKDIHINFKTTADVSGAEKSEQMIQKVEEAAAEAGISTEQLFEAWSNAYKKADEAGKEVEEGLNKIKAEVDELKESTDDAGASAEDLSEEVAAIGRAQKGQAIADLAEGVGKIADKFREAADEVEDFDKEAAASMRNTADRIETVTGAISQLALGFAVGGPLGAAVAALTISIGVLVNAFKDVEVAALRAAAREREAMREVEESIRSNIAAADERKTTIANGEVIGALNAELAANNRITEELKGQLQIIREKRRLENEVLGANDQADLAEVDRQSAAGEITPVQAAEKRAEIEAAARKRSREEKKREAIEDAAFAAKEAEAKVRNQEAAQKAFDRLEAMRKGAQDRATGISDYADKEMGKIVPDAETGQLSESDAKWAADIAREVATAKLALTETEKATAEAKVALETARNEAAKAVAEVDRTTGRAGDVVSAQNRIGEADERTVATRSDTRSIEAKKRKEEDDRRAADRAARERKEAERVRNAERDLETDITGIGKDAADATEGLGARGINPEGFNELASRIARKGDARGDRLNLAAFLEKVSMLVDAIPDSQSSGEDADKLRQVERKLEKKIADLTSRLNREGDR